MPLRALRLLLLSLPLVVQLACGLEAGDPPFADGSTATVDIGVAEGAAPSREAAAPTTDAGAPTADVMPALADQTGATGDVDLPPDVGVARDAAVPKDVGAPAADSALATGPAKTKIKRFGWNNRYLVYDSDGKFRVGYDTQQLHSDTGIDYRAKIDFMASKGLNRLRLWLYTPWFGRDAAGILHPWPVSNGRYNLDAWNSAFWQRFAAVVNYARRKGLIVEVCLTTVQDALSYMSAKSGDHAYAKAYNNKGYFSLGGDGDFFPQLYDTSHSERGVTVFSLQKKLFDKMLKTIKSADHVLIELSNEAPGWALTSREYVDWCDKLSAYIKSRCNWLVAAHAHGFAKPGNTSKYKAADLAWLVGKMNGLAHVDILNWHTYADQAPQVRNFLASSQQSGKVLATNENWNVLADASRHDDEVRSLWGHILSGAHIQAYVGKVGELGNSFSTTFANYLRIMAEVMESIPKWWLLRPIKGGGASFREDLTAGPGSVRELLCEPGAAYLAYFSGTKTSVAAKITLASGSYDYRWINIKSGKQLAAGTTAAGIVSVPAPPTSSWQGNYGLVLVIIAR